MFSNAAFGVIVLMFLLFCVVFVVKRRSREDIHADDRARGLDERNALRSKMQRLEEENEALRSGSRPPPETP